MSGEKKAAGCVIAILMLFITLPIWYVLLFWLLHHNEAPGWAWAAYWVYVPAGILIGLVKALFDVAD